MSRPHSLTTGADSACAAAPERCLASAGTDCGGPAVGLEALWRGRVGGGSCRRARLRTCRPPSSRRSRREQAQRPRRMAEVEARRKAVLYAEQVAAQGVSCPRAAAQLQLVPRTLREWRQAQRRRRSGHWPERRNVPLRTIGTCPSLRLPGTPAAGSRCADAQRNLRLPASCHGSGHRPARLAGAVPERAAVHPRRSAAALPLRLASSVTRSTASNSPGTTPARSGPWTSPSPGTRSMASSRTCWRSATWPAIANWRGGRCAAKRPRTCCRCCGELFTEYGPPLVLKSDNGSGLHRRGRCTTCWVKRRVAQLFSPVRRPQYNGALERSNGVLKTYTDQHAISAGHPFRWESEDVDHARQLANTISRPWGARGPSPEQAWQSRAADSRRRATGLRRGARRPPPMGSARAGLGPRRGTQRGRSCAARSLGDLQHAARPGLPHAAAHRPRRKSPSVCRATNWRAAWPSSASRRHSRKQPVTEALDSTAAAHGSAAHGSRPSWKRRSQRLRSPNRWSRQTPVREPQVAENSTPPQSPESVSAHMQDLGESQLAESVASDILLSSEHGGRRTAGVRSSKPVCSW